MSERAGAVVIGMGPGGEDVAGRLAEAGLDVIGIARCAGTRIGGRTRRRRVRGAPAAGPDRPPVVPRGPAARRVAIEHAGDDRFGGSAIDALRQFVQPGDSVRLDNVMRVVICHA